MKVVHLYNHPEFDLKLNKEYRYLNENLVNIFEKDEDLFGLEIKNLSDWRFFLNSSKDSKVYIQNYNPDNLDEIIDFDDILDFSNHELCEKIEYMTICGIITCLSSNITKLKNLKYLSIKYVSNISPAIKELNKLETLIISGSLLEYIPFEIYEIKSLKTLTIESLNYYENLSPRIHQLENLRTLKLRDCFPYISKEISQLQNLKCLDMEAPNSNVYDIPNLEALHIRVFDSRLLNGIKRMKNLKELYLDIREFNDEINEIISLKYLVIANYNGKLLPNFEKLVNLELLVIGSCEGLEAIPDFVFNLPKLKYLGLLNLKSLKAIPNQINDIPNLKYLDIVKSKYTIYQLPEFRYDINTDIRIY